MPITFDLADLIETDVRTSAPTPRYLADHHREHLRASAIPDELIDRMGIYTERDPLVVAQLLHWDRPPHPFRDALVFPFLDAHGNANCFARIKLTIPQQRKDGSAPKYEQPRGVPFRAYFTPLAIATIADLSTWKLFVEGEKKALACEAAGIPVIGLTGVFAWTLKREKEEGMPKGERALIPDLAGLPLKGNRFAIMFDRDPLTNPDVHLARCELARIMSQHGAEVRIIEPPLSVRDPSGQWLKEGADDYAVRCGLDALRQYVEAACADPAAPRSLDEWRAEMARQRVYSVGRSVVCADTSPAGAGKNHADMIGASLAGSSLIVLPSHVLCRQVAALFNDSGMVADAYPKLDKETCRNYDEAARAVDAGLSASAAVCPGCLFSSGCVYRVAMGTVEQASHRMATHSRAALSIERLAKGVKYVAIHEDAANLVRPTTEAADGFDKVCEVATAAGNTAWDRADVDARHFFHCMARVAEFVSGKLRDAADTEVLTLPTPVGAPRGAQAALYHAMCSKGIFPPAEATRICLAIASGETKSVAIRVDRVFAPGRATSVKKSVLAVSSATLPDHCPVWLCDATADIEELQALVDRPVEDCTPSGNLTHRQMVVQVATLDVKKGSSANTVLRILRAVFAAYPQFSRVGVLIDRQHVSVVTGTARKGIVLDQDLRGRVAKVEHFRSGESRGSNDWITGCDAIFVVGTPRVPTSVVRSRLIQRGQSAAAARDGQWDRDYWSGIDTAGRRRTILGAAYRDHDWRSAHRAVVRAELLQAIGRGRTILETGVPTIVVSNEDLGLPLAEIGVEPMAETAVLALRVIGQLSEQNSTGESAPELSEQNPIYILGSCSVSSVDVARSLSLTDRRLRYVLADLLRCGLVERVGQRGGWRLTAAGEAFLTPTAPASPPAGPAAAAVPPVDPEGCL